MSAKKGVFLLLVMAACGAQAIETNGVLLVEVHAASLSALGNNTAVSAWTNSETLGGNFVPAVSGQGAVYQTSVAGAPAVTFAASANSILTNTVPPPSYILSNNIWSAEIWVLNPSLQSPEDQFAWTDRGSWVGLADGTCMEIRYCADAANAVEHYNGTCNIPWSGNPPMAGMWHHIVITRSADGSERLYADGVLRTTKTPPVSNLRGGAPFAMGGVWDRAALNWQMLFSGSLAQVRVHSGTLSGAQVLSNFLEEREAYHAIWSGAPGAGLPWSDSANWLANNVAESGSTAWITNGGTAVLSGSLALNHLYPEFGGLTVDSGATLTLGAQDSVSMGNSGRPFVLTVADGAAGLARAAVPVPATVVNAAARSRNPRRLIGEHNIQKPPLWEQYRRGRGSGLVKQRLKCVSDAHGHATTFADCRGWPAGCFLWPVLRRTRSGVTPEMREACAIRVHRSAIRVHSSRVVFVRASGYRVQRGH